LAGWRAGGRGCVGWRVGGVWGLWLDVGLWLGVGLWAG
jgi:hypothetical protein